MSGNPPSVPQGDPKPKTGHLPVLVDEVVEALAIAHGETHVDGTFGAGGYTTAMLRARDDGGRRNADGSGPRRGAGGRSRPSAVSG